MLALNSLYDSSEIRYTLRLDCCLGGCGASKRNACAGQDLELVQRLRGQHLEAWAPLVAKKGNGVWAPACVIHTMAWGEWTDADWEVPAMSGNTQAAVVQWW